SHKTNLLLHRPQAHKPQPRLSPSCSIARQKSSYEADVQGLLTMYYFLMALVDIGFYIAENWESLTMNALFATIGVILGKRLGSRIVIKQMMKALGLEKKSKLE